MIKHIMQTLTITVEICIDRQRRTVRVRQLGAMLDPVRVLTLNRGNSRIMENSCS